MNLHQWITARVDAVEAEHPRVVLVPDGGKPIVGAITDAIYTADGVELTVTPGLAATEAVLRRCEADRRVLARHRLDDHKTWPSPVACHGCGVEGHCDDPVTEHINDCPELLDLAHAHGITPEELAALDRPEYTRPDAGPVIGHATVTPVITPDQIPAALRGRHWRGHRH